MGDTILEPNWKKNNILWMIQNRPGPDKLYRHFNVNYYPENVESLLYAAADRWLLVVSCTLSMRKQIETDIQDFLKLLPQHAAVVPRNIPVDLPFIAVYQSPTWLLMFHGFLVSLKSLLDLMGTIWATVADATTNSRGFHKANIGDEQLAGGKLANWFRGSCPHRFSVRLQAAQIIEEHSRRWITKTVEYRDTLAHRGDIGGLTPLAVRAEIEKSTPNARTGDLRQIYKPHEVAVPRMPDQTLVTDYCHVTAANAERFLVEMGKLFASDESRVGPGPPELGDHMIIPKRLLKKDKGGSTGA